MAEKEMAYGLPRIEHPTHVCDGCMIAKQTRLPFPAQIVYRAVENLELVHANLCGTITPQTSAGNKYFLLFVDDFSRMMWIHVLKFKSDALATFKKFKTQVENQSENKLKAFATLCDEDGIVRHLTALYTPQ